MVDNLVKSLSNIKSQYELKGLNFESDYVALYTEAREAMAALYDEENFGPQKLAEMGNKADPNKYRALIIDQRKNMKTGSKRVKQKAYNIQQEYRIPVTQGTRSGSSGVVCENWEQLNILWGGSAAAVCFTNCRTTTLCAEKQSDFNNHDEMNSSVMKVCTMMEELPKTKMGGLKIYLKVHLITRHLYSVWWNSKEFQLKIANKKMLKMKEVMVASLAESATQTSKAMDKIAESISPFGKVLGDGLMMIVMAMAPPQRQQVPSTPQASRMQMFSSHPSSPYQSLLQAPNVPHSTQHSFYGNMTGTILQETGERYQNL